MDAKDKDVAFVYAPADDGEGYKILRKRQGSEEIEAGVVSPLRSGRAISSEVVRLQPRRESPLLFDVETDEELSPSGRGPRRETRDGPAQVATERYRRGWDAIWGPKSGTSSGSRTVN
jgi:hypothetical protein